MTCFASFSKKIPGYLPEKSNFFYTRSVGDFAGNSIGVLNTPEIQVHDVDEATKYIMISINYIWFNFTKRKILKIIKRGVIEENIKSINRSIYREFLKVQEMVKRYDKHDLKKMKKENLVETSEFFVMTLSL